MTFDLAPIRYAITLTEVGSFVRAADTLGISQPALSRAISRLEKDLGVKLFDRLGGGVEPTDFGRRLLQLGAPLVDGVADLRREIDRMQGLEVGEIRIATAPYPSVISVGTAVAQFTLRHPDLRITLNEIHHRLVVEGVAEGKFDLGIADLHESHDDSRLTIEALPRHPVSFLVRREHRLANRRVLTLADILAYPMVGAVLPRAYGDHLLSSRAVGLLDREANNFRPAIVVESLRLAMDIARSSDAVVPAPSLFANQASGLVALNFWEPWMRSYYGMMLRRDRTPSQATVAFASVLRQIEQEAEAAEKRPGQV